MEGDRGTAERLACLGMRRRLATLEPGQESLHMREVVLAYLEAGPMTPQTDMTPRSSRQASVGRDRGLWWRLLLPSRACYEHRISGNTHHNMSLKLDILDLSYTYPLPCHAWLDVR